MANAIASGSATRPTVTPAATSAAAVRRSYVRRQVMRRGTSGPATALDSVYRIYLYFNRPRHPILWRVSGDRAQAAGWPEPVTTKTLSSVAIATPANSVHPPRATQVADSRYMPAASDGTPTHQAPKTIA